MTPAERAVLDAARALEPVAAEVSNMARPCSAAERFEIVLSAAHLARFDGLINDLQAAVRALPRPLSEQLAELRPGAVVEEEDGEQSPVLANIPKHKLLVCDLAGSDWHIVLYSNIRRVISNPEAERG